jgi:UDP-glucose:(heptosyl)LPS alpha-1,3-glucosyltransferase
MVVRRLSHQGGTERVVAGLAAHARESGHEVDVWCWGADLELPGVHIRQLKPEGRGRMGRAWAMQRAVSSIPREDYAVTMGFLRCPHFDLFRAGGGCHAAWLETTKTQLADHLELRLDRAAVSTARLVVVNSDMAARDLSHHYGLEAERLRLVRNGVDLQRFRPLTSSPAEKSSRRVGFLGSGFRRKGLELCLRAIARVPDLQLEVVGRDRKQARYQRLAERLGVAERVRFMGAMERPEEWLPTLGVMVLPTRYDPCANACMEAMACGVPVLSTHRNGASELLPEPWMVLDGLDDDEALSGMMVRALLDRGLGARCRDAIEPWSSHRASKEILQVVQELAR